MDTNGLSSVSSSQTLGGGYHGETRKTQTGEPIDAPGLVSGEDPMFYELLQKYNTPGWEGARKVS